MLIIAAFGRVALFLLALFGLCYWIHRLTETDVHFAPVCALCVMGVVAYAGGIVGALAPAIWGVVVVGAIAGAAAMPCLHGRGLARLPFGLPDACFLLGMLIFLWPLLSARLEHYDNFTHWAIALKVMLETGAFPTASSGLVEFFNYPLGTTSLLYCACTFLGHAEGTMLVVQAAFIFSCFYAVLGIVRNRRSFLPYAVLGAGCSLLTFFNVTIRINNLLVDFVLPVLTMACWAVVDRYNGDVRRELKLLVPLMAELIVVKSTGVVFVAFVLAYHLARGHVALRNRSWNARLRWFGATAVAGVLGFSTYLMWSWHMATALAGVKNKFDVGDAAHAAVVGGKNTAQIAQVVSTFFATSIDLTTRPALGFLLGNLAVVALLAAARWRFGHQLTHVCRALVALDFMTIVYYVGILAMYIFSMPMDEALRLAGFDRYACSIIALFVGGLAMAVTVELEGQMKFRSDGSPCHATPLHKRRYQQVVMGCIALSLGLLTSEYNGMLFNAKTYDTSLPATVRDVVGDRWPASGKEDGTRYLLFGSDRDGLMTSYYFTYVARYYLFAPHSDAICAFYEPNMDNLLSGYDKLIVIESNSAEMGLLKKHYGVTGKVGVYRIEKNSTRVNLIAE